MKAVTTIRGAAALAALLLSGTALAQTPPAPAPAASAPDPARLAAARQVVAKLLPNGSYKKMMGQNFDAMIDTMTGSMNDMPIAEIARIGGLSEEQARELGDARIGEVMAIYDPAWRERLKRMQSAMMGAMGDMMGTFEPRIQEAMARAYARDFTLAQLADLNLFFATPSGARYAERSLQIFMDPEVIKEMGAMMPELMKQMPSLMEQVQAATADLPKPRKIDDLSDAERKRLAELLDVPVGELKEPDGAPLP
ncbi:MAG: hypothetical protein V4574_07405 [Pseudomonadota bacterium]